jgi:hypothetical protein
LVWLILGRSAGGFEPDFLGVEHTSSVDARGSCAFGAKELVHFVCENLRILCAILVADAAITESARLACFCCHILRCRNCMSSILCWAQPARCHKRWYAGVHGHAEHQLRVRALFSLLGTARPMPHGMACALSFAHLIRSIHHVPSRASVDDGRRAFVCTSHSLHSPCEVLTDLQQSSEGPQ